MLHAWDLGADPHYATLPVCYHLLSLSGTSPFLEQLSALFSSPLDAAARIGLCYILQATQAVSAAIY